MFQKGENSILWCTAGFSAKPKILAVSGIHDLTSYWMSVTWYWAVHTQTEVDDSDLTTLGWHVTSHGDQWRFDSQETASAYNTHTHRGVFTLAQHTSTDGGRVATLSLQLSQTMLWWLSLLEYIYPHHIATPSAFLLLFRQSSSCRSKTLTNGHTRRMTTVHLLRYAALTRCGTRVKLKQQMYN